MDCEKCGGAGEYSIPAHQEAGNIVDEQIIKCNCKNNGAIGEKGDNGIENESD